MVVVCFNKKVVLVKNYVQIYVFFNCVNKVAFV
ncbi:MAG: hypothetical protein FD155_257 [Bacteroidetes bacterium]|jgi:hypothetical protein|nr:MAG: hypothetical protein FD155_257 [Bacteroidota bacterium]